MNPTHPTLSKVGMWHSWGGR